MSPTPITCRPDDDLATVASRMWTHDCGALPVVDHEGRVVAVITDRDVCMASWSEGRRLGEIPVSVAMSPAVHFVRPGDSLAQAMLVMKNHQLRRLPVVEGDGRVVGILSVSDLARAAASEATGVLAEAVISTIAEIVRQPVDLPKVSQPAPVARRGLRDQVYDLMALRDSIRVRLHLAGMDVRDRFHELEPKVQKIEREIVESAESASERVEELLDRLTTSLKSVDRSRGHADCSS